MIQPSRGTKSKLLRLLFSYVRPFAGRLALGLSLVVLVSALELAPPWLLKYMVDDVLLKRDYVALFLLSAGISLVFVLKGVLSYLQQVVVSKVGHGVMMELRRDLYAKVHRLPVSFFSRSRVGDLISRMTNDVSALQDLVSSAVLDAVVSVVSFCGMVLFMLYINWRLTLLTFATLPLVLWAMGRVSRRLRATGLEIQGKLSELTSTIQEGIWGAKLVRACAAEDLDLRRFQRRNQECFAAFVRGARLFSALSAGMEILLTSSLAMLLWFGGRDVIQGRITPGHLVAFVGYLVMVVQPLKTMSRLSGRFQQGLAAVERIGELMSYEEMVDLPGALSPSSLRGAVAFEDVWFAYSDESWVLRGVSFSLEPGTKLAIVGPTGAGKSTLVELLMRFYDPQRGSVRVDGVDLRSYAARAYRRLIGYVPQDPVILRGSFFFNIAYGHEGVTMEEVVRAAKLAEIHDFIVSLPGGYEAEVSERGLNLSGGQRQRLAIARALVRDPAIVILDEATSSLDVATERRIAETLDRALAGRTVLMVAHRLYFARMCDKIGVVEGGRLVEFGSHEELMELGGVYRRMYDMQSRWDERLVEGALGFEQPVRPV